MNIAEIAKKALSQKIKHYNFQVVPQECWGVYLIKNDITINFSIQEPRSMDWLNLSIKKGDKKYDLVYIRLAKKKEGFNFIETTRKLKKKTPPFNESDYYLMLQDSFENLEVNYPEVFTGNFPWEKNYREY
ncbi:MAG TPA: hypothetical protein PK688_08415 [Tenuifilaceae bacterium]|nr:hypothetical protein [Tenuifilaceae bacterium]